MNAAPKVSIVIPVYNGVNYLKEAIESALGQTYSQVEVLVVNDGSQDRGATAAVIKSYGERIRGIEKPNGGVASALNVGIREMTGDYFSWLSHDDRYLPEKLEVQMERALSLQVPTVFYSDYETIDAHGKVTGHFRLPSIPSEAFRPALLMGQFLHGCTLLIPKEAFKVVGMFPESLRTTQDYDLWFRMAGTVPFVHIGRTLVQARIHEGQGSLALRREALVEGNRFYKRYIGALTAEEIRSYWPHGTSSYYAAAARSMWRNGYVRAAIYSFWLSLSHVGVWFQRIVFQEGRVARLMNLVRGIWRSRLCGYIFHKRAKNLGEVFHKVYSTNFWRSTESRSGTGSDLTQTAEIRRRLPEILRQFGIRTMLDIPCGDFHWMKEVDLDLEYIGADIVEDLIRHNQDLFSSSKRRFNVLDITKDSLPAVDMVFCRDLLVHLSYADAFAALRNLRASGSNYLLTTTFTRRPCNFDIPTTGEWRPLNLQLEPFKFGEPLLLLNEKCTQGDGSWWDKSLGLWRISDLDIPPKP
jgi:glycosyltransferase involved in cell wall biosynthesis